MAGLDVTTERGLTPGCQDLHNGESDSAEGYTNRKPSSSSTTSQFHGGRLSKWRSVHSSCKAAPELGVPQHHERWTGGATIARSSTLVTAR